jgi:enoyl-CoA hydratase/carnithine racemase
MSSPASSSSSSSSIASARVAQLVSQLTAGPSASSAAAAAAPAVSIVSRTGGVAVILINNPPVNSLHPKVQEGISKCYEEACSDASIKAVVITGGNQVFMGEQLTVIVIAARSNDDVLVELCS